MLRPRHLKTHRAVCRQKKLLNHLQNPLAGTRASTLVDTLGGVETKALVDTLADQVAEAKSGKPCITIAHIKPEVLINTLANTLVLADSHPLGNTGLS